MIIVLHIIYYNNILLISIIIFIRVLCSQTFV